VRDTGVGIPARDLPHVFERFYRGDDSRSRMTGGAGLGLVLVRGLAQRLGGELTVESEVGRGSSFRFSIPAGDVSMAWQLLGQLETRLSALADAERLQRARDYRAAHLALADGALDRARVLLERLQATGVVADRDMLILSVLREMVRAPAGAHGARIDLLRRRLGSLLPPPPPRE